MWNQVADAVRRTRAEWAEALRAEQQPLAIDRKDDLAFVSKYSLFTTDPGVRGILAITNDLCYVRSKELELAKWRAPDEASATDQSRTRTPPQIDEARHDVLSHRASSCPSWARTRTLLIQSGGPRALKMDNLTGNGVPTSIGALSV